MKEQTRARSVRCARWACVLAGIILCQIMLYGPSLAGRKVLLPLDILAQPNVYLPRTPELAKREPVNPNMTDPVYLFEPERRFAAAEWRAGRMPMWAPYQFGGAPFIWPKFSPFLALECCAESPVILAWTQVLVAVVAGLGAYQFFRRALGVRFWPAAIGGWCFPLTGFFVLWQGYPIVLPVCWLPWILLAVQKAAGSRSPLAVLGLSVATCLVLISDHLDVAGQVLLASGVYGLYCVVRQWREPADQNGPLAPALSSFEREREDHRPPALRTGGQELDAPDNSCADAGELARGPGARRVVRAALRLAAAWTLGLLLATPYLLPVLEYTRTGARMARRGAGEEERPPVGIAALPQVVLPDMYGAMQTGSLRYARDHQAESSAAAYAGLLATVLVAPLAFCSRRQRAAATVWVVLAGASLAWCLDVPGFVSVMRWPGLNMLSHNRLVFVGSFAILALAVLGLEALWQGLRWRWWLWLPGATLAGLGVWCVWRSGHLPEPLATQLAQLVQRGGEMRWVHDLEGVHRAQASFLRYHAAAAIWCGVGLLGWLWLRSGRWQRLAPVLGALLVGDLLWFAHGRYVQCEPALYYPPIPALQAVAKAPPGRVMGYGCYPAILASLAGLRDIRGYDAVDPARMVDLLTQAADPGSPKPGYAVTMQLAPKGVINEAGDIRLPPVLDMLGVRYVILRGTPPANARPLFTGPDYWVLENPAALPRVFVPQRVELAAEDSLRLQKLASPEFDPRQVAYVEVPTSVPTTCRGTVEVVEEIPTRIDVSVRMETPGLVVLADRWDAGWVAWLEGKPLPILRVNHAVRGVVVPAGAARLEFRYQPASFSLGLGLAATAGAVLLAWVGLAGRGPNPKSER